MIFDTVPVKQITDQERDGNKLKDPVPHTRKNFPKN